MAADPDDEAAAALRAVLHAEPARVASAIFGIDTPSMEHGTCRIRLL